MLPLSALLLPVLLLVVQNIKEASGVKGFPVEDLFSVEAKSAITELQSYINKVDNTFDTVGDKLRDTNNLMEAILNYKAISEYSKKTSCKTVEKTGRSYDSDVDDMNDFIEECVRVIPSKNVPEFNSKVKEAQAKVKAADDVLRNAETCKAKPAVCEKTKKDALHNLNSIVSADQKAVFERDANQLVEEINTHVDECFTDKSENLQLEVEASIKHITDCLDLLP